MCILVVLNFLCARSVDVGALLRYEKPLRALASYTFTLYLVHALVMQVWLVVYPHRRSDAVDVMLLVVAIAAATWLVGQVTEHRKWWFEGVFARLAARLPLTERPAATR